jgi:hypothetical protein
MNQTDERQWLFTAAYLVLVIVSFYFINWALTPLAPKTASHSEFLAATREGRIGEVSIGETELLGTLKDEVAKSYSNKTPLYAELEQLLSRPSPMKAVAA